MVKSIANLALCAVLTLSMLVSGSAWAAPGANNALFNTSPFTPPIDNADPASVAGIGDTGALPTIAAAPASKTPDIVTTPSSGFVNALVKGLAMGGAVGAGDLVNSSIQREIDDKISNKALRDLLSEITFGAVGAGTTAAVLAIQKKMTDPVEATKRDPTFAAAIATGTVDPEACASLVYSVAADASMAGAVKTRTFHEAAQTPSAAAIGCSNLYMARIANVAIDLFKSNGVQTKLFQKLNEDAAEFMQKHPIASSIAISIGKDLMSSAGKALGLGDVAGLGKLFGGGGQINVTAKDCKIMEMMQKNPCHLQSTTGASADEVGRCDDAAFAELARLRAEAKRIQQDAN